MLPVQAERFAPAGIADVAVDISPEDTTEDAANMRRNLFEIGQQLDVSLDISAISQSNYGSNSMFDIADIVYEESSQQVETPAPLDCCAITNARCGPSASYPESGDTEYPCPCPVENSYLEISTPHTAEDTTTGTSTSCAGSCELETKQPHQREGNHPPCGDAALDNDTAGNQLKLSKDLVSTSPSAEASECSGRSADRATERVSTMLQGTEDTGAIADGIQDNPPSAASMSDLSSQSRRKPPAEPADSPLEGNKLARVFGGRACAPTAGQISMPASKPSPDQSAASDDMSTLHEHEASAGKKNHPFAAVIGLQITAGTPEMRIEVEPGPQYGAGPLGSSSSPQKSGQQAEQKRISEPFVDPPGGSSRMAYREGGQSATSMAEHDSGGHPKCATMEITIPVPRNANSLAEQADVTITGWPCNDLEKSPGLQEAKEPATGASGTERAVHCLAAQHDLQETIPESDDPLHMLMDIPTGTQPTGQNQQAAATGSAESSTACPSSDPFAGLFDIPVSHLTAEALYQP